MGRFTDRICDFWDNAERLLEDQSKWSQATFGTDQERKPIGALKHLAKEAIEAVDAVEADDRTAIEEEFADCFLLLMDAARRANLGGGDELSHLEAIVKLSQKKMVINAARKWPTPTSDEPVEHVRSPEINAPNEKLAS